MEQGDDVSRKLYFVHTIPGSTVEQMRHGSSHKTIIYRICTPEITSNYDGNGRRDHDNVPNLLTRGDDF